METAKIKLQHKLIKRHDYDWIPLSRGYTDKILYVNVGTAQL